MLLLISIKNAFAKKKELNKQIKNKFMFINIANINFKRIYAFFYEGCYAVIQGWFE